MRIVDCTPPPGVIQSTRRPADVSWLRSGPCARGCGGGDLGDDLVGEAVAGHLHLCAPGPDRGRRAEARLVAAVGVGAALGGLRGRRGAGSRSRRAARRRRPPGRRRGRSRWPAGPAARGGSIRRAPAPARSRAACPGRRHQHIAFRLGLARRRRRPTGRRCAARRPAAARSPSGPCASAVANIAWPAGRRQPHLAARRRGARQHHAAGAGAHGVDARRGSGSRRPAPRPPRPAARRGRLGRRRRPARRRGGGDSARSGASREPRFG